MLHDFSIGVVRMIRVKGLAAGYKANLVPLVLSMLIVTARWKTKLVFRAS